MQVSPSFLLPFHCILTYIARALGRPVQNFFFTGSMSSLRSHIRRHQDHVKVYQRRCTDRGIPIYFRAVPEPTVTTQRQGTLDSVVERIMRIPQFSVAGLLDYIVELIIVEDEESYLIGLCPYTVSFSGV
jgi:hypothetical protein